MSQAKKEFLMGNEVVVRAALAAKAEAMFGYPITPASEILEYWVKYSPEYQAKYLQTEDEMTAGFSLIGACLAGVKAFTATSGPGNVLMQDAFSMAEALRIPTVAIIQQRGGLSTSTVIYSQEEVTMTCFGGNGEGFRVVYSPAGPQDLYDYTIKAFNTAWKYRFPTFVLGDGYQAKTKCEVELKDPGKLEEAKPILLADGKYKSGDQGSYRYYHPFINKQTGKPLAGISFGKAVNMRNCLNLEEEIFEIIESYNADFKTVAPRIVESEKYQTDEAETIIFAHGIVAAAVKVAVDRLRKEGIKVGLFRPITLRPLPEKEIRQVVKGVKKLLVTESSLGQFGRMIKDVLYDHVNIPMETYYRPALGITPGELVKKIKEVL